MADTSSPQLANFEPAAVAALSPDARATFTASLERAGYSRADIDAKLGAQQQQSPSGSQQTPRQPVETLDWKKHPTLTDRQRKQAAETLTKFWTGDPQVLRDALEREGLGEVDDANDTRSEPERAFDAAFGGAAPGDYDLNGLYVGRAAGMDTAELAAFDADLRGALSAMEVPLAMGRSMAETLIDGANSFGRIPEGAARTLWHVEQKVLLERIGNASADHLTRLAAHALAKLPKATVAGWHKDGGLHSAATILQLARHGERLLLRGQMASQRSRR
jgi:hypothetical protein